MLTSIPRVNRLKKLQVLSVSGNYLNCIHNISCSEELKELDLANNYITEIGTTLMNCDKLEYLNLAGNPIKDIFSTQQLRCLPSLKVLQLYDPLYRITPIIKFVNYRLFVIENVPRLQSLDGFRIYREEAANVSSYFASKDIYYSVQHHNVVHIYFSEMIDRSYEHYQKLKRILERIFKAQLLKKVIIFLYFIYIIFAFLLI
uniref:Dynein axonemal assembly factor 1 homolog n=1 Tax=Rhodnius prolixus TaxID=13249 RepID=T1HSN1_RHOPR